MTTIKRYADGMTLLRDADRENCDTCNPEQQVVVPFHKMREHFLMNRPVPKGFVVKYKGVEYRPGDRLEPDPAPAPAPAPPTTAPSRCAVPPGGPALSGLDYIPLFLDFYDRYAELTYEERGRLVWAMLAYARGEDPAPHLTEALRRFSFPNEREVIDRTEKVHLERKERRKAASKVANAAQYKRTKSERIGPDRTESEPIGPNRTHNNNNNYNHNNNYNYNNNDNREVGARIYGKNRPNEAGRSVPVGRETIL